jgi:hypothetical protein
MRVSARPVSGEVGDIQILYSSLADTNHNHDHNHRYFYAAADLEDHFLQRRKRFALSLLA